jgi:formylmethanofuran dehydrogenase subunit E
MTSAAIPIYDRRFDELLAEAVRFHGDVCPGQVLGVRMAIAGCREIGVADPRGAGKALVVIVEIDRCPTDAIQALTGVSLGKRTLRYVDFGKTAATFVNRDTGVSVRVAALDTARDVARRLVPGALDPRRAQIVAYRDMAEARLIRIESIVVSPEWLDRPRVRVACDRCGEGITYEREVRMGSRVLCRACAGDRYYTYDAGHTDRAARSA